MDLDNIQTTSFAASNIRLIEPSDSDLIEAKASLDNLKSLLPDDINPNDEPALLFVAGNLAVAGMINLNDDGVDIETSIRTHKKFEKQQINIEHSRKTVVGYIIKAGLSEIGSDRILTEEEARNLNSPFNICVVIAFWKAVNKDLCNYIVEASNPSNPKYKDLSLSFEMGFGKEKYYIIALPPEDEEIAHAVKIITPENEDFELWASHLKANKGDGLDPYGSGNRVYRLMPPDVVPLGGGVVEQPAAAVKGLTVIDEIPSENLPKPEDEESDEKDEEDEDEEKEDDESESFIKPDFSNIRAELNRFIQIADKFVAASIIYKKTGVSKSQLINPSNMKQAELNALKEKAGKASTQEEMQEVVASVPSIVEAILQESERLHKESQDNKILAEKLSQEKTEALAAAETVKTEIEALKAKLAELQNAQIASAAQAAFDARMGVIDETFEFDDEEKGYIVQEIRDLDDEAFAKWMDKSKKLMKEKTKAAKKEKMDKMKEKKDEMCAALAAKGITLPSKDTEYSIEEVIASALANPISTPIHNEIVARQSLAEKAKAAFSDMTIGGKNLSEIKAKE